MKQIIYRSLLVLCFFGAVSTTKAEEMPRPTKAIEGAMRGNEWYEPQVVETFKADGTAIDKTTFIYDLAGNVTTELRENFVNGAWTYGYRRMHTYDESRNRLTTLMETPLNGNLVNNSINTYTYDAAGRMLTDVSQRWAIDAWVNNQRIIWTYDAGGNMLVKQQAMWQSEEWVNTSGLTYTYDENGNRLTEINDFKGVGQNRTTWTYDDTNNKLTEIKEIWRDNNWLNNSRTTWTYNELNKELTYLYENWTTDAWVSSQRRTNSYDERGNRLTQLNENWTKENVWVNALRYTWTYDVNGNILLNLYEIYSNNTWNNYECYECTYNTTGDMLTKLQERWTASTSTWGPTARYTWTYDANRNILSDLLEFYRNEMWNVSLQLTYTYDEYGNSISLDNVGGGAIFLYYNNMQSKYSITASTAKRITANYLNVNAEVVMPVTSVTLNETNLELEVGDEFQLEATIAPEEATNKDLSWSTSNGTVAKVDSKTGLVTAVAGGNAVITVTTLDGGFTATCSVSVKIVHVEEVTLNSGNLELKVGETFRLVATVTPDDATNKNMTWSTSKISVAIVGKNTGVVVAVAAGDAVITVTTADGEKTATCNVKVVVPVKDVTLNRTELNILVGDTFKLIANINPVNATNKEVKWSSSNNGIATVNNDGSVAAIAAGDAIITATSVDGGHIATCNVKVGTVSINDLDPDDINILYTNNKILITSNIDIIKVIVYDMGGKVICEESNRSEISTLSWLNGTYIVKAMYPNGAWKTKKIIVY